MPESKQELNGKWLFVDDDATNAASYCDRLNEGIGKLLVVTFKPSLSREVLLMGGAPAGVLMDVELSLETGERGTGLGLAQDVRAAQKAGKAPEYPVVRFARAAPVQANVGGDPASDDLFDDKIDKDDVGRDLEGVQRRLLGAREVYDGIAALSERAAEADASSLFGLSEDHLDWAHPSLKSRIEDGLFQSLHVAAGTYIRTFLLPTGLLLDRKLLLVRLGLDEEANLKHWDAISSFVSSFAFRGLGWQFYPRWWARGLEQAWYNLPGVEAPLAATPLGERAKRISEALGTDLVPLTMPEISPGARPWRWCALSLEMKPPRYVPVEPACAVRLTPRADLAVWNDPPYASLGEAIRNKSDRRLNRSDVERLIARA